ncbi:TIGR04222 domain-containing membrane protein [Archangium violaceum]|uniref:TIGR04222 domain-containing membrane protein n=1 Tax=Archangium violaceum TaxID=83451 RepID=UPI0019503819|nr:TIGR04222 domain-containing membrane protein [Archangium violaceum]QRN95297.1 TIGR04222 domain-containing membrane protein [Archangium violaceum]
MNPFDLPGPEFLAFYAVLAISAGLGAWWLRKYMLGPDGPVDARITDLHPYEVSFLSGGMERAVEAAVANLVRQEYLQVLPEKRELTIHKKLHAHPHPLEAMIHSTANGATVEELVKTAQPLRARLEHPLLRLELIPDRAAAGRIALYSCLLMLGVFAVGMTKVVIGMMRDRPVGFLFLMCLFVLGTALFFGARRPHRNQRGDIALEKLTRRNEALRTSVCANASVLAGSDVALAVGLFGVTALTGTQFDDLQRALMPAPSSGGDGGSSGSSCGGGCGGGGCGGCS